MNVALIEMLTYLKKVAQKSGIELGHALVKLEFIGEVRVEVKHEVQLLVRWLGGWWGDAIKLKLKSIQVEVVPEVVGKKSSS